MCKSQVAFVLKGMAFLALAQDNHPRRRMDQHIAAGMDNTRRSTGPRSLHLLRPLHLAGTGRIGAFHSVSGISPALQDHRAEKAKPHDRPYHGKYSDLRSNQK